MKKIRNKTDSIRMITQIILFVLIFLISISKWLAEQGMTIIGLSDASLHAICPFGGVVTVYEFVTMGDFIQKIHSSAFILMALGFIVAILFGTIFCGFLCPFGAIQEWIGKIGRKIFSKKFNHFVPKKLDQVLRYLRYVVLILVVYQTARTAQLVFQSVDPYYALFNFFTNEVALAAYVILGFIVIFSLFVERPWCKYLCPYGALLGIFNTFRIFKIRRNQATCIDCGKCDNICPMNIEVSKKEVIRDHQCITCYKCTNERTCPALDALCISTRKGGVEHDN